MACNDCGGGREGLVLSPLAGFYAGIRPPCVRFLLFRRGASLGTRMAAKSIRLPLERCGSPVQREEAVSLIGGRLGGGPDFNVINRCADRVYPPYYGGAPPSNASISPACGAPSTLTED